MTLDLDFPQFLFAVPFRQKEVAVLFETEAALVIADHVIQRPCDSQTCTSFARQ